MVKCKVLLESISAIHDFTNTINRYPNDCDLVSGRYTVDAKSIMGIYSLDLTQPIWLHIHGEVPEGLLEELAPVIVEG